MIYQGLLRGKNEVPMNGTTFPLIMMEYWFPALKESIDAKLLETKDEILATLHPGRRTETSTTYNPTRNTDRNLRRQGSDGGSFSSRSTHHLAGSNNEGFSIHPSGPSCLG